MFALPLSPRLKRSALVLALPLGLLSACSKSPHSHASPEPSSTSSNSESANSAEPSEPQLKQNLPLPAFSARFRGYLVHGKLADGSLGYEICGEEHSLSHCPGVPVQGEVPSEFLFTPDAPLLVEAAGNYDGQLLQLKTVRAFPPAPPRLSGGPLSQETAQEIMRRLVDSAQDYAKVFISGSIDEKKGLIEIQLEGLDPKLREILQKEAGREIVIRSFFELDSASLRDLPAPSSLGELPLFTHTTRSGASLSALARVRLQVDREKSCVYLSSGEENSHRIQPRLPFGYYILDQPLRLLDFDGNVVAREGELLSWGGGGGELTTPEDETTCGATRVWAGSPMQKKYPVE